MNKKNIAVFASGGGSGLQAIIDGCNSGVINANICLVISNNSTATALTRARDAGIPAIHLSKNKFACEKELEAAILDALLSHGTDIVFLAGYLKKVGVSILQKFEGNIYNIHPALLPKYGGRGMYGIHVHTAVIAAGESETGVTIHRVSAEYDTGETIAQCTVPVYPQDTPTILAARVLAQEHILLAQTLRRLTCQAF